jgi:xylulokinase
VAIGGLDIGTTGCKITVYSENGEFLGKSYREYEASRISGEHEIDPGSVWAAVQELISEVTKKIEGIKAIGVTSFGESFALLDENDAVLMPSMLITDPRGESECRLLVEKIGEDRIASITGLNPHVMYSISKLMWIKNNRPQLFEKTRRILLYQDYIVYMLTGVAQIDYSLATRTMAFDINRMMWSDTILQHAGIDKKLFSSLVPSGTRAGVVKPGYAAALGLDPQTLIVTCAHDQVAAAVGAGVFKSGMAIDGTGTVECITPLLDFIPSSPVIRQGHFSIVPYVLKGKYVCYAFSFTGGVLLKWFRDNFAKYESLLAKEDGQDIYAYLDRQVRPGPTGILVLPHFAGAATPYMDSGSKGGIVGLTLENTAIDIYKALMEGVTYEMLLNIEMLEQAGIEISMLRATGGGAKSRIWLQMKADILNRPIMSMGDSEAGAAGSVMLTGICAGVFKDLDSAAERITKAHEIFYPDPGEHLTYDVLYKKYKKLYAAIRPLVQ